MRAMWGGAKVFAERLLTALIVPAGAAAAPTWALGGMDRSRQSRIGFGRLGGDRDVRAVPGCAQRDGEPDAA